MTTHSRVLQGLLATRWSHKSRTTLSALACALPALFVPQQQSSQRFAEQAPTVLLEVLQRLHVMMAPMAAKRGSRIKENVRHALQVAGAEVVTATSVPGPPIIHKQTLSMSVHV